MKLRIALGSDRNLNSRFPLFCLSLATLLILWTPWTADGQTTSASRDWCENIIIPQTYRSTFTSSGGVHIKNVAAKVSIVEQVATTTLLIDLATPSKDDQRAELVIPVPDGAVMKGFTFQGKGDKPSTELLTKDHARATFESIVAKLKDPALLEFAGFNLIRSSVFPVRAGEVQKIQIVYEQLLPADGDRIDYVLPRSGNVVYDTPWKIDVKIQSKRNITTVYSPTHEIQSDGQNQKVVSTVVTDRASATPGPFQLSYLLEQGAVSASLFAYPDSDQKGGYFLLLAGTGEQNPKDQKTDLEKIQREITLVIDRSGSMRGKKLEQAKEAARQVIEGLEYGERFQILTYSDDVTSFSESAIVKTKESIAEAREFIDKIVSRGGTNLHLALADALKGKPQANSLPITLFLTDGLPTVGLTSELEIRNLATNSNPFEHRVFTFGVGYDVNTPLMDKIATSTRGFSTFVLPSEDVETKVAKVFKGLDGPSLASPTIRVVNAQGKPAPKRISKMLPKAISDLYDGDQLVLLGRYSGRKPLRFELSGNYRGVQRTFHFDFEIPHSAKSDNSFVARLWASRRIGQLTDSIRDLGAGQNAAALATALNSQTFTNNSPVDKPDPRLLELVDEIVSLSTEFGILTEYTSFLAEEGVDLSNKADLAKIAVENYSERAIACRTGVGSVNQEMNNKFQRGQTTLNVSNSYWTADMKRASITNVQQCNSGSFYRRGTRWVSNQLIEESKTSEPDRSIEFGSPEFFELLDQLTKQNRQQEMALEGEILIKLGSETILIKQGKE